MSYYAGDDPDVAKPWFMRKTVWIAAAIICFLLVLGLGIFTYVGMKRIPEIGGGITIEADPDTRIYMGDKLVGTAQVSFTWEELFGDEKHEPMVVELADPARGLTNEQVIDPAGSELLDSQQLSGGSSGVAGITVGSLGNRLLIRRANGELDEVFVIVINWARLNDPPRHYLLPIRVRKRERDSSVFFNHSGSSSSSGAGPGFMKAFGRSPIEIKRSWRFSAGTPPAKLTEEIKTNGLWEPGNE
jgi:hypothetical protein